MTKITKRTVEAAKPAERDYILWDDAIPSFGLRVFTSGRRSYLIQYRKAGRTKRYTLGAHGHLTADEARTKAGRLLGAIRDGADPSAEKKRVAKLPTIGALCDKFIAEYMPKENKASTAREHKRLIEKRIRPAFGTTRTDGLTRQAVRDWHRDFASTPYEGNRALAVMSRIISVAIADWDVEMENVCRGVKRHAERERNRYFSDAEFKQIGEALTEAENNLATPAGVATAIRLLALTGLRAGEVLGLRWPDVDLQHGAIHLPATKTGSRSVSIGAVVVAYLAGIERSSDHVVSGAKTGEPLSLSSLEKGWATVRDLANIKDARLHDFRHSVGTIAAQAGANAFMVRDKLGHRTLAVTSRYVERDTDPLRKLSDSVENRISAAMSGATADVEKMKRA